jgi:hypothetical protein
VTLNFNNNNSTAAVLLDIEGAFDTTRHPRLLYKLSKLEFSASLIKLVSSSLSQRKFRVSVEGEMPAPKEMQSEMPQGSVLSLSQTPGVYLGLSADDTCVNPTDCREGYVLRNRQCSLNSIATWCKRWNIKINENKTWAAYFPEVHLTWNRWNIPFVSHVKYLGVIFDKRFTCRLHIEMTEAKAFRTNY